MKKQKKNTKNPLEDWDVVHCKICHKRISMMSGILVGGDYYICKECAENGKRNRYNA